MAKQVFVNEQLVEEIDKVCEKIKEDWGGKMFLQSWQLFQMVATVMVSEKGPEKSELRTEIVEENDKLGVRVNGWNFDNDPCAAWSGFYRLERLQMVGWAVHLVRNHKGDRQEEMHRVAWGTYGLLWLAWENEPMIWGYKSFAEFYCKDEAQMILDELTEILGGYLKRSKLYRSELSFMYRVELETTRKVRAEGFDRFERRMRIRK